MIKKLLATTATLLLAAGSIALSGNAAVADDSVVATVQTPSAALAAAAAETTLGAAPSGPVFTTGVGIIGTLYPNTSDSNKASYWESWGPDQAICYSHTGDGGEHGKVTNGGKTVVLKPFNDSWPGDHWELLVVKAGTKDAVTIHPQAGVEYAAYDYKDVSHWIVCKGIKPAQAEIVINPGTCTAKGTVSGGATVNATWGTPQYTSTTYTIVATAIDGAKFPAGPGVSNDGTKKTFTGQRPAQLSEAECVASASVKVNPPTCAAAGTVVGINAVNATFGTPSYNAGTYTIVATATGVAKFPAGPGVSGDGKTKTFTGPYGAKLGAADCVASASVTVKPATCGADGFIVAGTLTNATLGTPQYNAGTYTVVATATGVATFPAGPGVSGDGKTKTLTGSYPLQLSADDCVASASVAVKPATCGADGYIIAGTLTNATLGTPQYNAGTYTVVATATGVATFPAGPGVSGDGKTKTLTGSYPLQLSADDCIASATVKVKSATCAADGFVLGTSAVNATFGTPVYENGTYTIVATATGVATFPAGPGVSGDGKTKTFTGPYQLQLGDEDCLATASVSVQPATCGADGSVVPGATTNATFGTPTYENGTYTIVATATGQAKFAPGEGVSGDGKTKTFTGAYEPQLGEADCVASAEVEVIPATCEADGFVLGTSAVNATFGTPTYENGTYTLVATATGEATFPAGEGVSDDGKTKTFTGQYQLQLQGTACGQCEESVGELESEVDPCLATAAISFGDPTCLAYGQLILGATVHATFGEPVIVDGQYEVVATADEFYHFAPGDGVSDDGKTKTFSGNLPPKKTGDECGELPDLDIVFPTISFAQPTCTTLGTFTLGGPDVQWFRNGDPIANGVHSLASGTKITLTVEPKFPHGFTVDQQTSWIVEFPPPAGPCPLIVLANTGATLNPAIGFGGAVLAILLGLGAMLGIRRMRKAD